MHTTTPPASHRSAPQIAIVGAGMAGAACARTLSASGAQVTLFDKSRGVGGRLSTRRTVWTDAQGAEQPVQFDHGATHFTAHSLAFQAVVEQRGWAQDGSRAGPPERRTACQPTTDPTTSSPCRACRRCAMP